MESLLLLLASLFVQPNNQAARSKSVVAHKKRARTLSGLFPHRFLNFYFFPCPIPDPDPTLIVPLEVAVTPVDGGGAVHDDPIAATQ
jgi:hypothetical protein